MLSYIQRCTDGAVHPWHAWRHDTIRRHDIIMNPSSWLQRVHEWLSSWAAYMLFTASWESTLGLAQKALCVALAELHMHPSKPAVERFSSWLIMALGVGESWESAWVGGCICAYGTRHLVRYEWCTTGSIHSENQYMSLMYTAVAPIISTKCARIYYS